MVNDSGSSGSSKKRPASECLMIKFSDIRFHCDEIGA